MKNDTMSNQNNEEIGEERISYPKLPPRPFASVEAETYISERFNDAISWYDTKAVMAKKWYQRMKATTVIGGALVPVLINIKIAYLDVLTTIISIIVVLLVSLISVFHYREQWVNYRSTEQFLRREYFLFTGKEGPYLEMEEADAYHFFVQRVEGKIEAENASTLQVLTTVSEAPKGQVARPDGKA
jgi:hypothetical protein